MVTAPTALNWILQQIGKSLNYDGRYGAQCWDLIMYYGKMLGDGTPPGVVGAEAWARTEWPAGYTKFTSNFDPQPGDIGIWGATKTNQYGHAFLVVGRSGNTMDVVDQNYIGYNADNGSPAARHNLEINSRLTAIIRPKFQPDVEGQPPAAAPQGKSNEQVAHEVMRGDWGNGDVRKAKLTSAGYDYNAIQAIVNTLVSGAPAPAAKPQEIHVVVNGENLSVIAAHYGLPNWNVIYDIPENHEVIGANPNLIHPGQRLIIPV
jgi:LysM repeat protein